MQHSNKQGPCLNASHSHPNHVPPDNCQYSQAVGMAHLYSTCNLCTLPGTHMIVLTHPLSTDTATGCTNTLSTLLRFTCFLCNSKCKRKGILTHLLSTLATYIILSAQRISSLLPAWMSCRLLMAMSCVMMKVWRGSHICSQATHGSPGWVRM